MKKSKKGFTIVELVIVIAVIGILAAVLIPTFTGVVNNARESAIKEEARNSLVQYMSLNGASIEGIEENHEKSADDVDSFDWDGSNWEKVSDGYIYRNDSTDYQVKYDLEGTSQVLMDYTAPSTNSGTGA